MCIDLSSSLSIHGSNYELLSFQHLIVAHMRMFHDNVCSISFVHRFQILPAGYTGMHARTQHVEHEGYIFKTHIYSSRIWRYVIIIHSASCQNALEQHAQMSPHEWNQRTSRSNIIIKCFICEWKFGVCSFYIPINAYQANFVCRYRSFEEGSNIFL